MNYQVILLQFGVIQLLRVDFPERLEKYIVLNIP